MKIWGEEMWKYNVWSERGWNVMNDYVLGSYSWKCGLLSYR